MNTITCVQLTLGILCLQWLQELGGCMMPLWPEYYEECSMLVYVVDAGNPFSLVEAGIQLHDMVQDPGLQVVVP
jgi:hypothetical protein